MINDIGDIVINKHGNMFAMIVDVEMMKANTYLFHLYDLEKECIEKWFEPFGQELSPNYWETLA